MGLAFDAAGNLLIADYGNNNVRKVDTAGTITTLAGTGENGYTGDGGPATAAKMRTPTTWPPILRQRVHHRREQQRHPACRRRDRRDHDARNTSFFPYGGEAEPPSVATMSRPEESYRTRWATSSSATAATCASGS